MSVLVNLEIPVKKERIEDFFDYLRDILVDTRAYEGCIRLDTYHEMENSKVLLIEEWEKIENQESYMQWRIETGLVEALTEFLDGELIIKKYYPKRDV
ncbi:MAG: antibiotic biosynthesis monooxygenase family protein [Pseudomonadota bacterium]|nr:antibiotic biosynthesis monooxygenase family protein [Pseudomonadota bacterium]MEC7958050.1 antibiotic biosynthesis monooxygenase family protein [Pseudomonadota bacterium]MEC8498155.1 antibiotic biosynthesis monooxygenase family protein [Pseudomonadota bacterium]MEC8797796.1 antibiotic biosynthesis monooxygenase family protein [Pseudomonadota bacterium]